MFLETDIFSMETWHGVMGYLYVIIEFVHLQLFGMCPMKKTVSMKRHILSRAFLLQGLFLTFGITCVIDPSAFSSEANPDLSALLTDAASADQSAAQNERMNRINLSKVYFLCKDSRTTGMHFWREAQQTVVTNHSQKAGLTLLQGPSIHPDWQFAASFDSTGLGFSVAGMGDVNNDDFTDVAVSAPWHEKGRGCVHLFYGSSEGLSVQPDKVLNGEAPGSNFGFALAGHGDCNGDGFDDLVVSAPWFAKGGKVYLYLGGLQGLLDTPAWTYHDTLAQAANGFSADLSGDLNGDGYDDLVLGAMYAGDSLGRGGAVRVFYGGELGLSIRPDWEYVSSSANSRLGYSVGLGDINGDALDDLVCSAPSYNGHSRECGCVFLFFGNASGLKPYPDWQQEGLRPLSFFGIEVSVAGDLNQDGYGDLLIGSGDHILSESFLPCVHCFLGSVSGPNSKSDWVIDSTNELAVYGQPAVGCGDMDRDGCDDILLGAQDFSNPEFFEGRLYLFRGGKDGLGASPAWLVEGNQSYGLLGYSACAAGDVDGDGYPEFVSGSPFYRLEASTQGACFLWGVPSSSNLPTTVSLHAPQKHTLAQNFPNPFTRSTRFRCHLPKTSTAELYIVNLQGAIVKHLAAGAFAEGPHIFFWDGSNDQGLSLAAGSYFLVLIADDFKDYLPIQLLH